MNHSLLASIVLAALSLTACDRPAVVGVPVAVPGPAGPQGATGNQGMTGNQGNDGLKGATGKPGDATTVIVMPAASAPSN